MLKRRYSTLDFEPLIIESGSAILAESVVMNSMISSVGQEIGIDETFEEDDFVNTTWETGTE